MKSTLLDCLVEIKGGGTPRRDLPEYWGGSIPWATVKDFVTTVLDSTQESITKLGVSKSATNIIPAGNIIVPTRMALGKAAINLVDVAINQDLKALIPIDLRIIDRDYLFRFLLSKAHYIESRGKGATVKGIRLDVLKELEVPLPPIEEQKRIAAILDKADAIRRKRRQAIQLADEFLRTVFLDMFGDPVTNKKGWERCNLGEVLENIDSGWSPKCYDRAANIDEWGVLKLGAVTSCRYLGQENKALPRDLEPREDIEVKKGDLLFTRKNTYELVAACSFVYETRPKLMLSDTIFRFNFKRNAAILSEYAWALLTHPGKRKDLQKLASGSAGSMPNISKSRLMEQLIELPPIELQQKFRNVFYRVRSCIESQSYAHNLATELFNSLTQRAFRGEL